MSLIPRDIDLSKGTDGRRVLHYLAMLGLSVALFLTAGAVWLLAYAFVAVWYLVQS